MIDPLDTREPVPPGLPEPGLPLWGRSSAVAKGYGGETDRPALFPNRSRSQFIGLSQMYFAMRLPAAGRFVFAVAADDTFRCTEEPIIALPYGCAVRQQPIAVRDARNGGFVRANDAAQRPMRNDGHGAWCRCGLARVWRRGGKFPAPTVRGGNGPCSNSPGCRGCNRRSVHGPRHRV